MLRQGRISSSFGRFVQETALLQTPFNILLQYLYPRCDGRIYLLRCALQKQDTHLLVPGVGISTTCRVQIRDLNSSVVPSKREVFGC
ncbi:BQ5605_C011g06634 [Microbotryum silenes-dioicae]|uniref:BQ5605_C011g06634 protein n=1 Tax=Microbotryum silenes-dioicae TaxID=796604 RepID=A0A2X0NLW5_9BASI|nr:BQ5605_C011g06634 [Microbotryum silenes-dioicae]